LKVRVPGVDELGHIVAASSTWQEDDRPGTCVREIWGGHLRIVIMHKLRR